MGDCEPDIIEDDILSEDVEAHLMWTAWLEHIRECEGCADG